MQVVLKRNWFAPDGGLYRARPRGVLIPDRFRDELPSDARIVPETGGLPPDTTEARTRESAMAPPAPPFAEPARGTRPPGQQGVQEMVERGAFERISGAGAIVGTAGREPPPPGSTDAVREDTREPRSREEALKAREAERARLADRPQSLATKEAREAALARKEREEAAQAKREEVRAKRAESAGQPTEQQKVEEQKRAREAEAERRHREDADAERQEAERHGEGSAQPQGRSIADMIRDSGKNG